MARPSLGAPGPCSPLSHLPTPYGSAWVGRFEHFMHAHTRSCTRSTASAPWVRAGGPRRTDGGRQQQQARGQAQADGAGGLIERRPGGGAACGWAGAPGLPVCCVNVGCGSVEEGVCKLHRKGGTRSGPSGLGPKRCFGHLGRSNAAAKVAQARRRGQGQARRWGSFLGWNGLAKCVACTVSWGRKGGKQPRFGSLPDAMHRT